MFNTKPAVFNNVILSGLTFYGYNELATMTLTKISAVTQSVANTAKRVVVIVGSAIVFKEEISGLKVMNQALGSLASTHLFSCSSHRVVSPFCVFCVAGPGLLHLHRRRVPGLDHRRLAQAQGEEGLNKPLRKVVVRWVGWRVGRGVCVVWGCARTRTRGVCKTRCLENGDGRGWRGEAASGIVPDALRGRERR